MANNASNVSRQIMDMYYIIWIVLGALPKHHLLLAITTNDVGGPHSPRSSRIYFIKEDPCLKGLFIVV